VRQADAVTHGKSVAAGAHPLGGAVGTHQLGGLAPQILLQLPITAVVKPRLQVHRSIEHVVRVGGAVCRQPVQQFLGPCWGMDRASPVGRDVGRLGSAPLASRADSLTRQASPHLSQR